MNLETFFKKFDLFADAPNAVAKMRELVLDLAIQGKLVERRSSEGDGHTLLKKLGTLPPERNSKSRSPKDIPVEPETPLEVPSHWALTTVENTTRDTGYFCDGDWVESKDQDPDGEVRLIQLADVGDGQYRDRSSRFMTKEAAKRLNCSYLQAGDILVARMPDPLGRCCRFPGDTKPAVTVVDVCILRSNVSFFDPDFLVIAINCPRFRRLVLAQATGTTRSRISRSNLGVLPIPLPPLAEQKRIVAKVDELMALCDRLEAQQHERETRHAALARASLARFADAPTPANLNFIFHKSYDIAPADLRRSILTLAVQGKLVPQDPDDPPAKSVLASAAELPDGHIRRRKIMKRASIASQIEMFPDLPQSWEYANVQSLYDLNLIVDYVDGNHGSLYPRSSEFGDTGVTFVTARDISDGRVSWGGCARLNEDRARELTKGWAQGGDVLLTHNATVGRVARVEREVGKFLLGTSVTLYRLNEEFIQPSYFYYVLCSPTWQGQLEAIMEQTTRNQVSIQKQAFFQVPLPPLAEQRRIAAKVDELMALVDALENQLATASTTAEKLMEAVVAELTSQERSIRNATRSSIDQEATPKPQRCDADQIEIPNS